VSKQTKTQIIGLIVIVLLAISGTTGAVVYNNVSQQIVSTTQTPTTDTTVATPTASLPVTSYKNGTYFANGSFNTPDGRTQIGVTLTIADDTITAVSIDGSGIDSRESVQYTQRFINGIDQLVIGKNVSSVSISRVSGASLTPVGFNAALETIKNDARA
jgi:uncharacterized protein with FMN-binding domain